MPIHLLVPGLLDPWPDATLQQPLPAFPVLEKLLARADQRPAPADYPRTLFSLLNLSMPTSGPLPTASLCWLADSSEPLPANILHADPVYLKPDMADVQLFRPGNLQIKQARDYARAFNDFYQGEGFCLHTPTADRWFLSAPGPVETPAAGLEQITGRNLRSFVRGGEQSREWSSLFTEIQMLFHELPVNQARQAVGELPVSGLWLSGGGALPAAGDHSIDGFQGEDQLLRGAAAHSGVSHQEKLPASGSNVLMVRKDCHEAWLALDFETWLEEVQQIEELLAEWIQSVNQVILYPCNGRVWHWHTRSRYHFWRRKHRFVDYLKIRKQ
jgi:hypothetical protein